MPRENPFDLKSQQAPGDFLKSFTGSRKVEDFGKMSANMAKTKKQIVSQAQRVEQASRYMNREYKQFVSSFKNQLAELMGTISDVEFAASNLESLARSMDELANQSENSARALKEESMALHNMYGTWAKAIAKHEKTQNKKDATAVEIAFKAYSKALNNSFKRLGEGSFFTKPVQEHYRKMANFETTNFFASSARIIKALEGFKKSLVDNEKMLKEERAFLKREQSTLSRIGR